MAGLAEPSTMRDNQCYTLLKFWYDRQTAGESQTFRFSGYLVGDELLPANDRALLPTRSTGHQESSVNPEPETSGKAMAMKKDGKGKAVSRGNGKGKVKAVSRGNGKGKVKAVSRGNSTGGKQPLKGNARDKKQILESDDCMEAMPSDTSSSDIQLGSSDSEQSEAESSREHISARLLFRGIKGSRSIGLQSRVPRVLSVQSDQHMLASPIPNPGPEFQQITDQPQTRAKKLEFEDISDLTGELKKVAAHLASQGKGEVGAVFLQTLRDLKVGSQSLSPVKCDSETTRKRERDGSPQLTPSSPTKKPRPSQPPVRKLSALSFPGTASVIPDSVPESKTKPATSPRKSFIAKAGKSEVLSVEMPRGSRSKTRASEQSRTRSTRTTRRT
jgi:hypothetical protein